MTLDNNMRWFPHDYHDSAVVAEEAEQGLLARLEWITRKPQVIADVGCGLGTLGVAMAKRYPEATVLSLDLSEAMATYAKNHTALPHFLAADAHALPFFDHSIDLLAANLLLPWSLSLTSLLQEWQRVVKPGGLIIFTALGLDSLKEWRAAGGSMLPALVDMHDIGDALVQTGWGDPVLDVDYLTMTYTNLEKLSKELKATGMISHSDDHTPNLEMVDGVWPLTYEIIHAHAFAPPIQDTFSDQGSGIVRVPLAHIRKKLQQ